MEDYSSETADRQDIEAIISPYRATIVAALSRVFRGESPFALAAREATEGGKKLRPVICLMTCEAVCGSYRPAIPAALAYELAHSASLVQDDMIDESDLRHDKLASHKKQGFVKAILTSDLLLFQMFEVIATYGRRGMTPRKISKLLSLVSNAAKLTAQGEYLEMELSARPAITEEDYLRVASLKTGALFAATSSSGALAGGASARVVDQMYQFGRSFGVAFQISDDVLDVLGDTESMGKPVFKDLQNNACNIVLVDALSKADTYQKNAIMSMLYRKWFAPADIEKLKATLESLGARRHAEELAERELDAGRALLKGLPRSQAKENLVKLTYCLGRRSV